MMVRRVFFMLSVAAIGLFSLSASADTISFAAGGNTSTTAWQISPTPPTIGTSQLSGSSSTSVTTTDNNITGDTLPLADGTISFTTGTLASESSTQWTFNDGGTITVSSLTLCGGACFSGQFTNTSMLQQGSQLVLTGLFIAGDVNSSLLSALHDTNPFTSVVGNITVDVSGNLGDTSGTISSIGLEVSQTPEPASMALLGTGLLFVGGTLRRRLVKL